MKMEEVPKGDRSPSKKEEEEEKVDDTAPTEVPNDEKEEQLAEQPDEECKTPVKNPLEPDEPVTPTPPPLEYDSILKEFLEEYNAGGSYKTFEAKGVTFDMLQKMDDTEMLALISDPDTVRKIMKDRAPTITRKEAHTYETQRWFPLVGWGKNRLPTDIPEWSVDKRPLMREQIQLPKTAVWVTQWAIDRSSGDKEGWEYAGDWWWSFHDSQKKSDCVRKRKWVRTYEQKQASTQSPQSMLLKIEDVKGKLGLVLSDSMVLTEVEPSSAADRSGASCYIGQKLTAMNGQPVSTPPEVLAEEGSYLTLLFTKNSAKPVSEGPHKLFPNLPASERLVDDFQCTYTKTTIHKLGRMYITHNYVCFTSRMSTADPLMIPFDNVLRVEKKLGTLFNSITVHTPGESHPFSGFFNVEPAYQLLERLFNIKGGTQKVQRSSSPNIPSLSGSVSSASPVQDVDDLQQSVGLISPRSPIKSPLQKSLDLGFYSVGGGGRAKTTCPVFVDKETAGSKVVENLPPGTVLDVVEVLDTGVVKIKSPEGYIAHTSMLVKNTSMADATLDKSSDLRKQFPSLAPDEQVVHSFSASYKAKNHVGKLWATDRRLVFTSHMSGKPLDIALDSICEINKKADLLLLKAISITTADAEFTFTAFLQRDTAFDLIFKLWSIKTGGKAPKSLKQQQRKKTACTAGKRKPLVFSQDTLQAQSGEMFKDHANHAKFTPLAELIGKSKQILAEQTIDGIGVGACFEMMFNEKGFLETYHKKRGAYTGLKTQQKPIKIPDWDEHSTRHFTCTTVVQAPWAKHTRYDEFQRYATSTEDGKNHVHIHIASQTPEITYGDTFRVEVVVTLSGQNGDDTKCSIKVDGHIHFIKSTMLKGKIESTGMSELKTCYAGFATLAKEYGRRVQDEGGEYSPVSTGSEEKEDVVDDVEEEQGFSLPENVSPQHAVLLVPLYFFYQLVTTYFATHRLVGDFTAIAYAFNQALVCAQDTACDPSPATASLKTILDEIGSSHAYYAGSSLGVIVAAQFCVLCCSVLGMLFSSFAAWWVLKGH